MESVLGRVRFRRAYYCCRRCQYSCFPFDDETGIGTHRLTPGAERLASLLGLTCDGFEAAAKKVLPEACGLHLSESTVQRVTEDAGARLGSLQEQGHTLGEAKRFAWHQDAQGRTCAYVSLDLTGVPQQAKGGGPAEGRLPYVAAIYNPVPEKAKSDKASAAKTEPAKARPWPTRGYEPVAATAAPAGALPGAAPPASRRGRPRMQARYISGLLSLVALGVLLRREAAQVGLEQAQQGIGLCDGGNGLEDFLRTNFNRPNLVLILDFWHPTGYRENLARAWHPDDEEHRVALAPQWCQTMKHHGGAAILAPKEASPPPPAEG